MSRFPTRFTLFFASSLVALAAACGGTNNAAPANPEAAPGAAGDPAAGDQATGAQLAADQGAQPGQEPQPDTPAGDAEVSDETLTLMEEGAVFLEEMADVAEANAEDCDAMAEGLSAVIDDNTDLLDRMNEAEGDTGAEEVFEEEYEARYEAAQLRLGPPLSACMDNPNVQAALEKLERAAQPDGAAEPDAADQGADDPGGT